MFSTEPGFTLDNATSLDADRFDEHCDHILVREDTSGELVGCYRMLPPPGAIDAMVDARGSGETPLETVDVALSFEPYSENGVELGWVPAVFGFSTVDLQRLVKGLELDPEGKLEIPRLVLREDLRERIAREKIQSVAAEMRDDGLYARVDGALLPHLAWSEESLVNLSDLLMRLYPGDEDGLPDDAAWVPLVRATAPMYNDYDLALQFAFPGG